jgi:hypothetical protein
MGALKVRVGGSWVTIPGYGNTLGVPAGGVASDFLLKNSATDGDARWGTTTAKLKLTPGDTVGLDLQNPALQIGEQTGQNLVAYWGGLISRNNGAAAILRLNYYGGNVSLFGGAAGASALLLGEPTGTGKRTMLDIGGWEFGQDQSNNGTKDFYLYAGAFGTAFNINAAGNTMLLGTGVSNYKLQVGQSGAATLQVGDDAYFIDANLTNGLSLRGLANAAYGSLYFGNGNANRIGYDGEFRLVAGVTLTVSADNFQVLNSAGSAWKFRHNGTTFENWGNATFYNDIAASGNITAGAIYATNWLRARTNTGLYLEDRAVGWNSNNSNWMELYGGSGMSILNSQMIRFNGSTDGNHGIGYNSSVPTGSGEASNGPRVFGWSSVWLHNVGNNKSFYLSSNGNVFVNSGCTYNVFSSREFKDNIVPLSPDACLDTVRQWRPVEFDYRDDEQGYAPARRHAEGFISEEMVLVTPSVVNVTDPDAETPNWPNAIAYDQLTVHLTGAVQALLARIEQLERKAA